MSSLPRLWSKVKPAELNDLSSSAVEAGIANSILATGKRIESSRCEGHQTKGSSVASASSSCERASRRAASAIERCSSPRRAGFVAAGAPDGKSSRRSFIIFERIVATAASLTTKLAKANRFVPGVKYKASSANDSGLTISCGASQYRYYEPSTRDELQ